MACEYWYDGKFRTEEDFKSILENGLIDQLISEGKVDLKNFELNKSLVKNKNAQKSPITLRITRHVQRNLNIDSREGNEKNYQNPLNVFGKDMKLVVRVGDSLYAGKNKLVQKEINDKLNLDGAGELSIKSFEIGKVYALVESSYGLYPVQLFNNKIKDTNISGEVFNALGILAKAIEEKDSENYLKTRKFLEKKLYRTTVKYDNGQYIITKLEGTDEETVNTFDTKEKANEFLGNQLYRVDSLDINRKGYNETLANDGAIVTDTFLDNGNIFHSSSFQLEAYTTGNDTKKNQEFFAQEDGSGKISVVNIAELEAKYEKNKEASTTNKSGETEAELFGKDADQLQLLEKINQIANPATRTKLLSVLKNNSFIRPSDSKGNEVAEGSDNHTHYVNTKTKKVLTRTTSYISEKEMTEEDRKNPAVVSALTVGSKVDVLVRDFFAGTLKEEYDVASKEVVAGLVKQLEAIKAVMDKRGETVIPQDIVLYNDEIGVAGTVDLLTFDKEGTIRIYDVKTSKYNEFIKNQYGEVPYDSKIVFEKTGERKKDGSLKFKIVEGATQDSKREKHQKQLSMYRMLLNNTHGLLADTLAVMPIKVNYTVPSASTTELTLQKGVDVKPLDTIKEATLTKPVETIAEQSTEEAAEILAGFEQGEQTETENEVTTKGDQGNNEENKNILKNLLGNSTGESTKTDEDEDINNIDPSLRLREKKSKVIPNNGMSKERELEVLQQILGSAYKRQSGKKGTVRVFKDFETLKHYLPAKTYAMLLEARKNGQELYGLFTAAAVLIQQNAPVGVAFHEAFHVIFNLALPVEERVRILNEAYIKYKEDLPATIVKNKKGFVVSAKLPTYLEIEEYLADKYMEYVNSDGELIKSADVKAAEAEQKKKDILAGRDITLKGSIKEFFNAFSKMSKVFYSTQKVINIDNLFEDITVGEYSKKVQFRNTALDASVRQMSDNSGKVTNPDRKYVNKEAERQGFVALNHIINKQLNLARQETNSKGELTYSKDLDDKGLISKIGVHSFISRVVHDLAVTLVAYQTKADNATGAKTREYNQYIANNYQKLFNILTNNGTAVNTNSKTGLIEFIKSTDLLERFITSLQKRGLYIDYSNGTRSKESTLDVLENDNVLEDDAINNLENGEETSDGVAMRNHIEVDPRESISQRLKTFFAQIPKLDSAFQPQKNSFGVQEFEDPAQVFKFLISKVSNSYTMESMMEKLQGLNKPYIADILDALEEDPILQTHFWVSIGSRNYATYKTVYEKNGSYQVISSNRKDVNNIVSENLISNFLDPANPLFVGKNIQELNQEEVKIFKEGIETAIKEVQLIKKLEGDEALPFNKPDADLDQIRAVAEVIETLSKLLAKYKISISEDELLLILNPPAELKDYTGSLNNFYTTEQTDNKKTKPGLLNVLKNIVKELEEGKNSFTSLTPIGADTLGKGARKATSLVETLGRAIIPAMQTEVVASFRNVNNKTAYNLIASGHLNKMITELQDPDALQDYLEKRKEDSLLANLPYIEDLQDPDDNLMDTLETVILDGLSRQGKNKSVQYSKMSDIELEATSMGMFLNNVNNKEGYYKLGIPSDSPTLGYVKGKKYSTEEIQNKLLKTAEAEIKRMQVIKNLPKESSLRLIPNYIERGQKFQLLSFLNGKVDTSKPFVEIQDAILEEIKNFTDSSNPNGLIGITIKKYLQAGVISEIKKDGSIVFAKGAIDKSFKNDTERKAFFENYILNTFYHSTQLNTIFAGDPSFYKGAENHQKRFKQIMSPGTYTTGTGTFNAVILNDSIIPTTQMQFEQIQKTVNNSDISQSEKDEILGIWRDTLESKKETGNNESDGGTYVSLSRRKKMLQQLGRWDSSYDAAFKRLEAGTETIEDLNLINDPFKPEKPFMFTKQFVDGVEIPMQIKNSETVLTKSFALAEQFNEKTGKQEYKYPELAAVYLDMNGGKDLNGKTYEAKYDTAIFESAVKVGALGNKIDKDGKVRFSQYVQQADGSYQLEEGFTVIPLKEEDYRLQQETPPHYLDDRSNFGTQLRNLIIADLDLEGTYNIEGYSKPISGAEVVRLFQELVEEDLKESYFSTEKEFLDADENINWDRLLPILRKEALNREMGQEILDAITSAEKTLGDTDNLSSPTVLPLFHPSIKYKMFALMNSIFKNRVTKQKIKGGQLVNTPSYGVSKDLKMKVKDGRIVYEALLPWTSREFFPTNEKGEVSIEFIREHAPELLELVANRVPTEDKYSMFSIEVVGFTPQSMGGTIILPPQVTTVAGLDFDIDKLFFMQRAYRMQGKIPKVIKYINEITEDNVDQIANNLFSSHKSLKSFLEQSELDNELAQEILTRREELILAEANNRAGKKEIKKTPKFLDLTEKIDGLKLQLQSTNLKEAKRKSIQSEISEAISELQEDFVPFNDAVEENNKLKENVIDVLKAELRKGNVNPVMFNGKAARDNAKISIIEGILRDPKTATSILHPGNFDSLKEQAAFIRLAKEGKIEEAEKLLKEQKGKELIEKSKETDPQDFNINYPSTQLELFRRNMDGSDLIGIMANHNVHHAKAMHANVVLHKEIYIDKVAYQKLDNKTNVNGERISRLLATNLAAVVDNANDPVANFLNMNTYTADTIAFLTRLGVPQNYIYLFINQPAILELTRLHFNEQGSLSKEKIVSSIMRKWGSILSEKYEAAGIKPQDRKDYANRIGTTSRTLRKTIDGGKDLDYYVAQMNVLNKFDIYQQYGQELGDGVQAARVDTVGMGPTDANNYMQIAKIQKLKDRELGKDGNAPTAKILGLKDIVLGSPGITQTMIPAFTKYSLLFPTSILNKIFPSIGAVKVQEGTSDFSLQYSVLGKLKNKMAELTPTGSLTEKEANLIDNRFIDFISSGFDFFDYKKSTDIIDKMPSKLASLKEKVKNPDSKSSFKKYKYFLDQIYKVDPNRTTPISRIEYYKTGKNALDTERFTNTWELMLKDSDPEINKFAQDLVQYVYFANGYTFGPFSFANLIPVYFWSDEYQSNNKEVNTKNKTFNQFLYKMFEETKFGASDLESVSELGQTTEDWESRFIDQFIRNFGDQGRFATTVQIQEFYGEEAEAKGLAELTKRIEGKPGEVSETELKRATMAMSSEVKGVIKNSKGSLIVNVGKNPNVFKGKDKIPVQFIKVFSPKNKIYKAQYYKYHSSIDGSTIDPNLSEKGSSLDAGIYVLMPNLGLSNFLTEFNFFDDIQESLLKDITHLDDLIRENDLSSPEQPTATSEELAYFDMMMAKRRSGQIDQAGGGTNATYKGQGSALKTYQVEFEGQNYSIVVEDDGLKIFYRGVEGKQMNDVTSNFTPEQRRQIFLKQAIAAKTGTTVEYKGNKYGVNKQEEIFLLNTGKLVSWPKTSPAYMEVLELANKKLGKTSTTQNTQKEKEGTGSEKRKVTEEELYELMASIESAEETIDEAVTFNDGPISKEAQDYLDSLRESRDNGIKEWFELTGLQYPNFPSKESKMSIETFKEEIKKIIDKKQQENFESEEAAEAFMNSESLQSAARIVKDPDIFNTVSEEELNRIISDLENC